VAIPVQLFSAVRRTRTSLRMLGPDGTPLVRRYFDPQGKALEDSEIERGYEIEKGKFVLVSDQELEALLPEQSRDIALTQFVREGEISPIYVERSYVLVPASKSNVAYRLLASTMESAHVVGVASFVLRERQYMAAIRAERGVLHADTLRFADELRSPSELGLPKPVAAPAREVQKLKRAISALGKGKFSSEQLKDHYWERLEALAERKHKHRQDLVETSEQAPGEESMGQVIDLMAVLQESLAKDKAQRGQKKEAPAKRKAR